MTSKRTTPTPEQLTPEQLTALTNNRYFNIRGKFIHHLSKMEASDLRQIDRLASAIQRIYEEKRTIIVEAFERQIQHVEPVSTPIGDVGESAANQTIWQVIDRLDRRIYAIVRKFHLTTQEEEDAYSTVLLKLAEKADQDPTFVNQEDPFILQYTKWMVLHEIESATTYIKYVSDEEFTRDEEGEEVSVIDFIPDSKVSPEDWAIWTEAINEVFTQTKLAAKHLETIKMLYAGFRQTEIAETFQVSKPAITQWLQTIRTAIAEIIDPEDFEFDPATRYATHHSIQLKETLRVKTFETNEGPAADPLAIRETISNVLYPKPEFTGFENQVPNASFIWTPLEPAKVIDPGFKKAVRKAARIAKKSARATRSH